LAAFPRVLLPFASRIIVIASFVLLLLLLNQIQISNPFGNKKNAHESTPKLSKKKENALSLSHPERDRTLSLSLFQDRLLFRLFRLFRRKSSSLQ
jgi:hypothetical protein